MCPLRKLTNLLVLQALALAREPHGHPKGNCIGSSSIRRRHGPRPGKPTPTTATGKTYVLTIPMYWGRNWSNYSLPVRTSKSWYLLKPRLSSPKASALFWRHAGRQFPQAANVQGMCAPKQPALPGWRFSLKPSKAQTTSPGRRCPSLPPQRQG